MNCPTSVVELKRKIALANHRKPDLIIKNANIVNVLSGEIYNANVAIADGIFVGIWDVEGGADTENINAESVFDAQGRFMSLGLIDGHIHIESTFLSPTEFCNMVAPHGTSAGICDPHEITNVPGYSWDDYILQLTHNQPVKVYLMMPSCVNNRTNTYFWSRIGDMNIKKSLSEIDLQRLVESSPALKAVVDQKKIISEILVQFKSR